MHSQYAFYIENMEKKKKKKKVLPEFSDGVWSLRRQYETTLNLLKLKIKTTKCSKSRFKCMKYRNIVSVADQQIGFH